MLSTRAIGANRPVNEPARHSGAVPDDPGSKGFPAALDAAANPINDPAPAVARLQAEAATPVANSDQGDERRAPARPLDRLTAGLGEAMAPAAGEDSRRKPAYSMPQPGGASTAALPFAAPSTIEMRKQGAVSSGSPADVPAGQDTGVGPKDRAGGVASRPDAPAGAPADGAVASMLSPGIAAAGRDSAAAMAVDHTDRRSPASLSSLDWPLPDDPSAMVGGASSALTRDVTTTLTPSRPAGAIGEAGEGAAGLAGVAAGAVRFDNPTSPALTDSPAVAGGVMPRRAGDSGVPADGALAAMPSPSIAAVGPDSAVATRADHTERRSPASASPAPNQPLPAEPAAAAGKARAALTGDVAGMPAGRLGDAGIAAAGAAGWAAGGPAGAAPSAVASGNSAAPAASDGMPTSLSGQIATPLIGLLNAGDREVVLRLQPPELGDLSVRVRVSGRDVSAWFDTPFPQVQQALTQGMVQLHSDLATAGYNLNGAWVGGDSWTPRGRAASPAMRQTRDMSGDGWAQLAADAAPVAAGSGVSVYV